MVLIVVLLGAALLALALWFTPVQVRARFHQEAGEARIQVQVRAPAVNLVGNLNITEKVAMVLEHLGKRWRATGEPVEAPLQKTIRRLPWRKILRALRGPVRYLARRTQCRHLEMRAEVGGADAMESALLAGASWAVVGVGLGWFSRQVRLAPAVPRLVILPNYSTLMLRIEADCILEVRLGHAIVTGVWVLRRVFREKELLAWARDSWRRKGEVGNERTSDSGTDEDRHG